MYSRTYECPLWSLWCWTLCFIWLCVCTCVYTGDTVIWWGGNHNEWLVLHGEIHDGCTLDTKYKCKWRSNSVMIMQIPASLTLVEIVSILGLSCCAYSLYVGGPCRLSQHVQLYLPRLDMNINLVYAFKSVISIFCCSVSAGNISLHFQTWIVIIQWDFCLTIASAPHRDLISSSSSLEWHEETEQTETD